MARRFWNQPSLATFFLRVPQLGAVLIIMESMMKNLLLGTAMAMALGTAASAQDMFRAEMDPVAIAASDFIGKRVYAAETAIDAAEYAGVQDGWNDIGEINDVILTRDGNVDAVLVDIGGFLGMGERQVALGMENIRFVADSATADAANDYFLVINADRTVIEGAPEYMRSADMGTDPAAAPMTDGAAVDQGQVVAAEGTTDGAVEGGMAPMDGYANVDAAGITGDQLRGVRVYGPNEEDLGEISDIVLTETGAPAQVIVDVGGFLGIGQKPVALEVTDLQLVQATDGSDLRAYVQMTQEQLEGLPNAEM
ncbi:PRC-barrel domain-containing protein [Tabrizicola piscis]|nr:PRC-barrel domain-containing protein [Tabrizicola piscis]